MGDKNTPDYCRKEAEIARIESQLAILNKIVMGNGQEGLATSVPKLAQSVDDLNINVHGLSKGVGGLLRFQAELNGTEGGKEAIRKRNRWIIGILITVSTTLLGALFFLIDQLMNHLPT